MDNKEYYVNALKDITFELINVSNVAKETLENSENSTAGEIHKQLKFIKSIIKDIHNKLNSV